MGPLIRPPAGDLENGAEGAGAGRVVGGHAAPARRAIPHLWSPGVKYGVRPGSYTHLTEFFGPVLGVMRFEKLAEAIALVNQTGYGLTSGLESLDDREQEHWKAGIRAGNLYINRATDRRDRAAPAVRRHGQVGLRAGPQGRRAELRPGLEFTDAAQPRPCHGVSSPQPGSLCGQLPARAAAWRRTADSNAESWRPCGVTRSLSSGIRPRARPFPADRPGQLRRYLPVPERADPHRSAAIRRSRSSPGSPPPPPRAAGCRSAYPREDRSAADRASGGADRVVGGRHRIRGGNRRAAGGCHPRTADRPPALRRARSRDPWRCSQRPTKRASASAAGRCWRRGALNCCGTCRNRASASTITATATWACGRARIARRSSDRLASVACAGVTGAAGCGLRVPPSVSGRRECTARAAKTTATRAEPHAPPRRRHRRPHPAAPATPGRWTRHRGSIGVAGIGDVGLGQSHWCVGVRAATSCRGNACRRPHGWADARASAAFAAVRTAPLRRGGGRRVRAPVPPSLRRVRLAAGRRVLPTRGDRHASQRQAWRHSKPAPGDPRHASATRRRSRHRGRTSSCRSAPCRAHTKKPRGLPCGVEAVSFRRRKKIQRRNLLTRPCDP